MMNFVPEIQLPTHGNKTRFYGYVNFQDRSARRPATGGGDSEGRVDLKGDGWVDDGFLGTIPEDKVAGSIDSLYDHKLKRFLGKLGPRTEDNMPTKETLTELTPKILGPEWKFGFFSTGKVSSGGKSWRAKDFLLRGPSQSLIVNFRTSDVELNTRGAVGEGFRFKHKVRGQYEANQLEPRGGYERAEVWSRPSR